MDQVTVSLEDHLIQVLKPLQPILPPSLGNALSTELTKTEIRYSTLSDISRWTRSAEGSALLKSARLNSGDYHLVSLLAGTKTSPRSKPPPYIPPESPEKRSRKEWNDRKALTAVANSLLSIGCAGGAAWWIADKQGWKDEWVGSQAHSTPDFSKLIRGP